MPDFVVRFVGDVNNLAQFDAAIRRTVNESVASLQAANTRFTQQVGPDWAADSNSAGLFATKQQTIIDSVNRTFRQQATVMRRYIKDYKVEIDELNQARVEPVFDEIYFANINRAIGDLDRYEVATRNLAQAEGLMLNARRQRAEEEARLVPLIQAAGGRVGQTAGAIAQYKTTSLPATTLLEAQTYINTPDAEIVNRLSNQVQQSLAVLRTQKADITASNTFVNPGAIASIDAQIAYLEAKLKTLPAVVAAQKNAYAQSLPALGAAFQSGIAPLVADAQQAIAVLEALNKQLEAAGIKQSATESKIRRRFAAQYRAQDLAANAAPPIPPQLAALFQGSPEFLRQARRAGLGIDEGGFAHTVGSEGFRDTIARQGIKVNQVVRDVTKGETNVGISFESLGKSAGVSKIGVQQLTAAIRDDGTVITKWGGQLSGVSNVLAQTARTFQRTVQYIAASTIAFGSLALVLNQFGSINEINANMTRLGVTAGLTTEESTELFTQLSEVAYNTATPIRELIKSADDMALAVRGVSDTAKETRENIIALSEAVGILTNLSGIDTVKATDLLSASFKQLQIAPGDLVDVLSKVTAVAGGQSNAIADIVQGLGSVAEAAKNAGFTIDEMIGAIQTLSQVTSKSPADVATAFKNLFGSLASPGSVKVLKEFGIAVYDAQNQLRPFLDVYGDINNAIRTGRISEGEIQRVIRGISGGPRRAPDAAALLSNYNQIAEATGRATRATNEALIANSRVLSTNQAKIVQFQNAFDTAVYEQFNEQVEDLITNLAELGKVLLQVFRAIPSGIAPTLIQFALLLAGVKALQTVFKTFIFPPFRTLLTDVRLFKDGLTAVGTQMGFIRSQSAGAVASLQTIFPKTDKAGRTYFVGAGGRSSRAAYEAEQQAIAAANVGVPRPRLPRPGLRVGAAAALVGGALAYGTTQNQGGGFNLDVAGVGNILQIGGGLAALIPGLQGIGLAALAAGTAMSFLGEKTEEVAKATPQNAAALYDAITQYRTLQSELTGINKDQEALKNSIITAEKQPVGERDADDLQALSGLYIQYADNVNTAIQKNTELRDSMQEILNLAPEFSSKFGLSQLFAQGGSLNEGQLNDYLYGLSKYILEGSQQNFVAPENLSGTFGLLNPTRKLPALGSQDVNLTRLVKVPGTQETGYEPVLKEVTETIFRLNDLAVAEGEDLKNKLTSIFADGAIYDPSIQAITIIDTAIKKAGDSGSVSAEQVADWRKQLQLLAQTQDSVFAYNLQNESLSAYASALEITGKLTGDQAKQIQGIINLRKQLLQGLGSGPLTDKERAFQRGVGGGGRLGYEALELKQLPTEYQLRTLRQVNRFLTPFDAEGNIVDTVISVTEAMTLYEAKLKQVPGAYESYISLSKEAQDVMAASYYIGLGVAVEGLTDKQKDNADGIAAQTEALKKYKAEMRGAFESQITNLYSNRNDLEARLKGLQNTPVFDDDQRASRDREIAAVLDLLAANEKLIVGTKQLNKAFAQMDEEGMDKVRVGLSKIHGLEGLLYTSNENVIGSLITLASQMGLSAQQTQKFIDKIIILARLLAIIDGLKAAATVEVTIATKQIDSSSDRDPSLGPSPILDNPDTRAAAAAARSGQGPKATAAKSVEDQIADAFKDVGDIIDDGIGDAFGRPEATAPKDSTDEKKPDVSTLQVPDEFYEAKTRQQLIDEAIARARQAQSKVPGEAEEAKDDIVALFHGTEHLREVRGIKEEYLREAIEELTEVEKKRLEFETKADTIRRIRIGSGSFAAIANVPFNAANNVSVGGPQGPINVNINGQVMTPAQFETLANRIAAILKKSIATG